jgi:hypothetical protein
MTIQERQALKDAKEEFKSRLAKEPSRMMAIQDSMVRRLLNARVPNFGSVQIKRLRALSV